MRAGHLTCILVFTSGCTEFYQPGSCPYEDETRVTADTTTEAGTLADLAAPYIGTFLARPVWVGDLRPAPGELDELIIDVGLVEGKVHLLHSSLMEDSPEWCPEQVLESMLTLQLRNLDGSFWASSEASGFDVHATNIGIPGSFGMTSGMFEVHRHPPQWDERVPGVEGWETTHEYTVPTIMAWDHQGALPDARTDAIPIHIAAVYDHLELEDLTGAQVTMFRGYLWDLERL